MEVNIDLNCIMWKEGENGGIRELIGIGKIWYRNARMGKESEGIM